MNARPLPRRRRYADAPTQCGRRGIGTIMAAEDERGVGRLNISDLIKRLEQLDRDLEIIRSRLSRDNRSSHLSREARSELVGAMATASKTRQRLIAQLNAHN
ncbi:hypothetical protein SCOCK_160120 [Actinacidiphila cocklensis]|uniref:Uncharacterized protein n=1 Tax=Actinacidiphila cocklensis TaxID=887465 RepID=A0A9W4GPG2_9ACTN|nr:hypothetical protein SCOCK_160120 [Actinacidiphila cocklensis]